MKLPLDTLWGTIISGVILTALLVLVGALFGATGVWIDIVIVLICWLGMFGVLRKPM